MKGFGRAAVAGVLVALSAVAVAEEAGQTAYMASDWLAQDTVLQYQKGFRYQKGFEYDKAFEHYLIAAERGYPLAMRAVGIFYANGSGVARDDVEAYKWLMLSGEGIDLHNAKLIARDMTAEQLAEAERRLAAWRPTIDE